jgi:hypothetical protein
VRVTPGGAIRAASAAGANGDLPPLLWSCQPP